MYDQETSEFVKLILAGCAALIVIAMAIVAHFSTHPSYRRAMRYIRVALLVTVVAGCGNYYCLSLERFLTRVNGYDMVHYYLGSKYFEELGYYDTYPALLLADSEDQRFFPGIGIQRYRDHASQQVVPVETMMRRAPEIRARFSQDRWNELKRDLRHFIEIMPVREWPILLEDRGYNATPVGRSVGAFLSTKVSVENLKLLGFLDVILLAVAVAFVAVAFGINAMLLSLAFLFTSFSGRWPPFGESLLRMDWIAGMMIAICLLRLQRPTLAGVCWGYAICIRVFPAIFLIGPIVRVLAGMRRNAVFPRNDLKFIAASVLMFAAMNETVLLTDGLQSFRDSVRKLRVHQESTNLSSQRVGLGVALAYRGELYKKDSHSGTRWPKKKQLAEAMKPYRYSVAAGALYLLSVAALRKRTEESVILGMAAFFFVSIASYYYYIMRVLLVTNHAADVGRPSNATGLALLFLIEVFSQWHQMVPTSRYAATAQLSIALTVYFLTVIVLQLFEDYDWGSSEASECSDART